MKKEFPYLPKRTITKWAFIIAPAIVALTLTGVYGSGTTFLNDQLDRAQWLLGKSLDEGEKLAQERNFETGKKDQASRRRDNAQLANSNARLNAERKLLEMKNDFSTFNYRNAGVWQDQGELTESIEWYRSIRQNQDKCLAVLRHKKDQPECNQSFNRLFGSSSPKRYSSN